MTIRTLHGPVVLVGLLGTFVFVLVGVWVMVSRVWAASFTQTLEVMVAAPFIAAWVLAPMLWEARPRSEAWSSDVDALISFIAASLLVSVAACAYVYVLLIRPLLLDVELQASSLMLVLIVPGVQWVIIGIAGAIRSVRAKAGTR